MARQTTKKTTKPKAKAGKVVPQTGSDGHAPDSSPLPALPSDDDFVPPESPKLKAKGKAKAKAIPPRSPLPGRAKRVVDPGKPDQPRSKRSSEQVDAANEELAALKAEVARLHAERLETLAEMELDDEAAAQAIDTSTVRFRPSAGAPIIGATFGRRELYCDDPNDSDIPCLEFDDEDFDAAAEADERIRRALKAEKAARKRKEDKYNLSKLPPLAPLGFALVAVPAPVAKVKPPPRKRGDARAIVDEAKQKVLSKRALSGDDSDDAQPQKKIKPAFPSGVVKDWRSRVTVLGAARPNKVDTKRPSGFPIGGLTFDDVDADRPSGSKAEVNNTIEILTDSDEDPDETPTKLKAPTVTVKKEKVSKPIPGRMTLNLRSDSSNDAVSAFGAEVSGLPEFARSAWVNVFLPTLHHYLGTREGWDLCMLGEEVPTVQQLVDIVYVGTTYKVKKGCPIYSSTISRVQDKRHWIGSTTSKVVDVLFTSTDYNDKPNKIMKFAKYAIEAEGPAWYEVPAPRGLMPGDDGYSAPTGLFRSKFVLDPLAAYVKCIKQSKGDFGNKFVGAIALICTGYERAFNQYISTGVKTLNGSFSKARVGHYVLGWTRDAMRLEDFRWRKINAACFAQIQAEDGQLMSASTSMNLNRGAMALGSSPAKDDENDMY
ncbi:hypothetical protein B0H16DRAFT_1891494 [Mycena metata]|uniref:Uncharacterized protein n=1 Tax=Mycena metata TaxID=1033252 RepID=A0AAD7MYE4_9AGAR|nr:hypothetical protein B0H16DRAFT_1891494 [Mycena metata]